MADSATAAQDALSDADRAAGVKVMDPRWGYRYVVDESDIGSVIQPFDTHCAAVQELRAKFTLASTDVVIATYPKCGTTWMQQICLLLMLGSDAPNFDPMVEAPWLEMAVSKAATGQGAAESGTPGISVEELCRRNAGAESRVWKTHAPRKFAPWRAANPGAKVIVVSRHAKDCAVSMLHHTRNIPGFGFTGGWDVFAELFLSGRVESSCFWEWHAGWWAASTRGGAGEPEILWVTFEALKADLLGEVRRISEFLGLRRSEEELAAVAARSTFAAMKAEASARDAAKAAAGKAVKKEHFRAGVVGGWREVMTPEVAAAFDHKTRAMVEAAVGGGPPIS